MPAKNTQMRKIWHRIESWLSQHTPDIRADLHKGAHEKELRSVEQQLGVRFPVSVRECYRIHNRADGYALLGGWEFLSLDQMLDNWKWLKKIYDEGHFRESGGPGCQRLEGVADARRPVRRHWWNPKWIPFTR